MKLFNQDNVEVELAQVYCNFGLEGQFGGGVEEVLIVRKGLTKTQLNNIGFKFLCEKYREFGYETDTLPTSPEDFIWGIYLIDSNSTL